MNQALADIVYPEPEPLPPAPTATTAGSLLSELMRLAYDRDLAIAVAEIAIAVADRGVRCPRKVQLLRRQVRRLREAR